ncbi:hypothetical protein AAHC03_012878 [Spirometra sp. Aus1]
MCEPSDLSRWGEVFVLLIYDKDRAMAYRNAAVKEKAVLSRYRGKNVGCTTAIASFQGNWNPRKCVGLMKFASFQEARRWLESDHPFKQHDFLGQVEVYLMPLTKQEMSHKGYPIIHIFNQHVSFKDVFETKLLPEMEKIVHHYGGVPLVVSQNEPLKWRGVEPPGAIIINQWPNWEAYDRFNASDDRKKLNELCKSIGNGYEICAELEVTM